MVSCCLCVSGRGSRLKKATRGKLKTLEIGSKNSPTGGKKNEVFNDILPFHGGREGSNLEGILGQHKHRHEGRDHVEREQDSIDSHEPPKEEPQSDDAFHDRDEEEQGSRIELIRHHVLRGVDGENLGRTEIRVKLEKSKMEVNEAERNPNKQMRQWFGICRIERSHKNEMEGNSSASMKDQSTNEPHGGVNS